MAKASDNLFPYVHLVPAAAPSSPAAGSQLLYLDSGDSNKLKRKDSSGTVTAIEGTAGSSFTPKVKWLRWTGGDIKISSTSFAAFVDNASGSSLGTSLDLTLPSGPVSVGDTIEVAFGGVWRNDAVDGFLTFATIVSGSIVNTIYGDQKGLPGAFGIASAYTNAYATGNYVVQSGDLSSGALTVRPVGKCASAATKVLLGGGTTPNKDAIQLTLKNYGPQ